MKDLQKRNKDFDTVSRSLSDFMTQNTVLKNQLKQQEKKDTCDSDTQTLEPGVCLLCVENESLTKELVEVLDSVQKMVEELGNQREKTPVENGFEHVQPLHVIEKGGVVRNEENLGVAIVHEEDVTVDSAVVKPTWSSMSQSTHLSGTGYIPSKQDTTLNEVNKFQPVQFVNNESTTLSMPQSSLPLVPGPDLYSQAVKGYSK